MAESSSSRRTSTAASHALDEKVPADVIAARREELMAIQQKISARRLRHFRGRQLPALVEGPSKENELVWQARLGGMAPDIDGKLFLTDLEPPAGGRSALAGDLVTVEITESHDYDLVGRVVAITDAVVSRTPAPRADSMPRISTGAPLRVLA